MKNFRQKIYLYLLVFLVISVSCARYLPYDTPVISNFPLKQDHVFTMDGEITKLASSNEWTAISTTNSLTAIDLVTHKELWSKQMAIDTSGEGFQIADDMLAFVANNQVYLITKDGTRSELDIQPKQGFIIRLVAFYSKYIYLLRGPDWNLEVYDTSLNSRLWSMPVGRAGLYVFYDSQNNIVYINTQEKGMFAVDNSSGDIIWRTEKNSVHSTRENNYLFLVENVDIDEYIFSAFDIAKMNEIWRGEKTRFRSLDGITVINQFLLVNGDDGVLVFDKDTGAKIWHVQTETDVSTVPVYFQNNIFFKDIQGTLYAVSANDGKVIGDIHFGESDGFYLGYETQLGVYEIDEGILFSYDDSMFIYGLP